MRCYRKILSISYKDHVINKEVCAKKKQAVRPHKDLLTIVKRCKLQWYGDGHVSCSSGLSKMIMQGTVKGGRRQGRQRKRWEDNIREWTGLEFSKSQRAVENKKKMEETGCEIICGVPTTLAVKGLMMMMVMHNCFIALPLSYPCIPCMHTLWNIPLWTEIFTWLWRRRRLDSVLFFPAGCSHNSNYDNVLLLFSLSPLPVSVVNLSVVTLSVCLHHSKPLFKLTFSITVSHLSVFSTAGFFSL